MTEATTPVFKEMRVKLDNFDQAIFKYLQKTPEAIHASDSLKLAKAWTGKLLGHLGEDSPYTNHGNRHKIEDIEPAADTSTTCLDLSGLNEIECVDLLREKISEVVRDFDAIVGYSTAETISVSTCLVSIAQHLAEARFWLGFELGRIRRQGVVNNFNK